VQKPLTAKQQAIYDLKCQGKTIKEIAAIRGVSMPVVNKSLCVTYKKLGLRKHALPDRTTGAEHKSPEVAAAALEAAADPLSDTRKEAIDRVNEQLKAAGVPERVSDSLMRRLRVKYANAVFADPGIEDERDPRNAGARKSTSPRSISTTR
jgi:hypothetical protein